MDKTLFFKELVFGVVLPGIGLGLLGLIVYYALSQFFCWLGCRSSDKNNKGSGK